MNRVSDKRIEGNSYNQMNRRTLWMAGGLVLIVLVIFSVFFMTKTVTAQREGERYKQVISIEIKKGDTLWSIASEYMSENIRSE
jgi:cell division protein YceG involved in septum cleavage